MCLNTFHIFLHIINPCPASSSYCTVSNFTAKQRLYLLGKAHICRFLRSILARNFRSRSIDSFMITLFLKDFLKKFSKRNPQKSMQFYPACIFWPGSRKFQTGMQDLLIWTKLYCAHASIIVIMSAIRVHRSLTSLIVLLFYYALFTTFSYKFFSLGVTYIVC